MNATILDTHGILLFISSRLEHLLFFNRIPLRFAEENNYKCYSKDVTSSYDKNCKLVLNKVRSRNNSCNPMKRLRIKRINKPQIVL